MDGKLEATVPKPVRDLSGLAPGTFFPDRRPPKDPNGLQTMTTLTEAKHGSVSAKIESGWLWIADKGKIRAALVAPDAERLHLAPDKSTIAYATRDNLFVRRIEALSAKDLDEALEQVEKQDLMSRAKQVGTAMAIYGSDYDDLFPPNADWQRVLHPYLKNYNLTVGFVYEMNGEDATKIEDVTNKRLGYINGKYGRAIVFADSHAIWERRRIP